MGLNVVLLLGLYFASSVAQQQLPFWPLYPGRTTTVLDGSWQFGYGGTSVDPTSVTPAQGPTPNVTIVPSAFDVQAPGVLGPRGTAFYRTTFSLTAGKTGLLYFAACAFYCRVFVDDVPLAEHRAGGYQPFWVSVPASASAQRALFVVVDNQYNTTTAPTTTGGDFYFYGGITRHVIAHELRSSQYIIQVETFTVDPTTATLNARVVLSAPPSGSTVRLSLAWDGNTPSKPFSAAVNDSDATATLLGLVVPGGQPWTFESPNLHTLTVNLLNANDDIIDAIKVRFGLRVVGISNARITLNGQVVKLRGYNRHTMWPDTGSSVTPDQIETDIALLKEIGANYVRGAHYPQDQHFLDRCDEEGIAIWEEALGPGVSTRDLLNPYFMQYQIQAVNEMVSASINHPSVFLHAFYNEGPSNDPRACPGYAASADAIRARVIRDDAPQSRLVTWASDQKEKDVCLAIADVVSFNDYPAWYYDTGNFDMIVPAWESHRSWALANFPAKPFTISETGGGAIYEWTNASEPQWSQGFQTEIVSREAKWAMGNETVSGITLWQFGDIKADDSNTRQCGQCDYLPHPANLSVPWTCGYISTACGRPGGENHKGVVDFWRRKKESFAVVQAIYTAGSE